MESAIVLSHLKSKSMLTAGLNLILFILGAVVCVLFVYPPAALAQTNVEGSIYASGYNDSGGLGDGSFVDRATPVPASGFKAISVDGGGSHSLAVKSDGTAWSWGNNTYSASSNVPIKINELSNVRSVDDGDYFSLALKHDGTVLAWGYGYNGEMGNGTTSPSRTPVEVSDLDNIVNISAGASHSLAVKSDGTVWSWGNNYAGQLGDGSTSKRSLPVKVNGLTDVTTVAAGAGHSLALKSDGTVWMWGRGASSIPTKVTNLSDVADISAGGLISLAVKSDGTVWEWRSEPSSMPSEVSDLTEIVDVSAGYSHKLALKADGTAWAWGSGRSGQLGDGSFSDSIIPVKVKGLADIVGLSAGSNHSLFNKMSITARPEAPTLGASSPANGSHVSASSLTFSGKATPNSVVKLYDSGDLIGKSVVPVSGSKTGTWRIATQENLTEGTHYFTATVTVQSDNVSSPSEVRTVTVDRTAPESTITSAMERFISTSKPVVTFEGTDNITKAGDLEYSYRVDGGSWSESSVAKSVTLGGGSGLSEGEHKVELRTIDHAGNEDASPATYIFTVDTITPNISSFTGPPKKDLSNLATFSFSYEAGAELRCILDETEIINCASPQSFTDLEDGDHTFTVRAADKAGNTSDVESYSWSVNTRIPTAEIRSTPRTVTNDRNASFRFSSSWSSSFLCSLDGEGFGSCESPRSYFGLASGTHTFKVKAAGVPGNETPATYTWTIDTTKPVITPLSPKANSTIKDTTPTIKATVKDGTRGLAQGGKVGLSVGGKAIAPSKFTYNASNGSLTYNSPKLTKGKKQVKITATDAAGNTTSKTWFFTIK